MGIKDSYELALQDWLGSAGFDRRRRARTHWGRASGPRPTSTSPPARSATTSARSACRSLPAGRLGRARRRRADRPRQLGAALPPHLGHRPRGGADLRRAGAGRRGSAAWSSSRFRHQVDELIVEDGAVGRRPRHGAGASDAERGVKSSRETVGEFELRGQAVIVTSGGIGHNHDLIRAELADRAARRRPRAHDLRRARPRRRPDARDHRGRRRAHRQPRPDVALHRGHPQLGPDLARPRDPDHPRPVVAVVRRQRASGCRRPNFPGFDTLGTLKRDPRDRLRLLLVHPHPVDHREGVRALGLRAEPRHHRARTSSCWRAGWPRARRARSRRSRSTARTSWWPTPSTSWSPG